MSSKAATRLSIIPDSREWKTFFIDAGIPAAESATYALTFAQNRIQSDMLVNINKDYLQEMGITLIGDIIAILRHSRRVYDEIQRRTIMKSTATPTASSTHESIVSQSKVSQTGILEAKKVSEKKVITRVEKFKEEMEEDYDDDNAEDDDDDDSTDDDEDYNQVEARPAPVRKTQPSIISKAVNRPAEVELRPLKRVPRRNMPEPTLTVRMPEKTKILSTKKTSVFTRLGEKVDKLPNRIQQKVTMREMESPEPQRPHSSNALPYVGILKNKKLPVVRKVPKKISTMRADEEQKRPVKRPAITWVASDAKVKKATVKDRLGSVSKINEKPIQVKDLGSTTPRIPIVYNESEVSTSKKVSFGPVQKKEFDSYLLGTGRFRVGWQNS